LCHVCVWFVACVVAAGEELSLSKLFVGVTFLVTHIDRSPSNATPPTQHRGINCSFGV